MFSNLAFKPIETLTTTVFVDIFDYKIKIINKLLTIFLTKNQ